MAGENILAKDIGGLPVGVWALVVIGGVAVGWFLLRPKTTGAPVSTGTTTAGTVPPNPQYGIQGPPGPPGPPGTQPPVPVGPQNFYTIQASDIIGPNTVSSLAARFHVDYQQFLDWNCTTYPAICAGLPIQPGWLVRIA